MFAWLDRKLNAGLAAAGSSEAYGRLKVRKVTDELVHRFAVYRGSQDVALTDHALRYWVNGSFDSEKLAVVDSVLISGNDPCTLSSAQVDAIFTTLARYLISTGDADA